MLSMPPLATWRNGSSCPDRRLENTSYPKLGDYLARLQAWLELDAALPSKRRRTAERLFECLQVEGYLGGYCAVRRFNHENSLSLQQKIYGNKIY